MAHKKDKGTASPSSAKPLSTKPLMLQGTASHVGKSVLTAAVLRILKDRGLSVAPFKPQNMALNSAVTVDGGEIGRAQAFQAMAAGIEPTVDMNPVLLKPTGDQTSQVIIHGKVHSNMSAKEYHLFKGQAMEAAMESYRRLAASYDAIVIEGAGSPAEINLRDGDIANMGTALAVGSPVVLVADIDRGGVFAAIIGTLELLAPDERALVKGFIINKFRGDLSLLKPGLEFLEDRTGLPVLGVVPWMDQSNLPDEDGVALYEGGKGRDRKGASIRIAVVKLPRISNFTDFDPFAVEDDVALDFITDASAVAGADMVIIPGSKNTVADLRWMGERGIDEAIKKFAASGGTVAGICGGFQMLGKSVSDPHEVETGGVIDGLGLLDCTTTMAREKTTRRVSVHLNHPACEGERAEGYEIHMGETVSGERGGGGERPFAFVKSDGEGRVDGEGRADGAISHDGLIWGTYAHGVFDNDRFRGALISGLLERKGLNLAGRPVSRSFATAREAAIASLASTVEGVVDVALLMELMGLPAAARATNESSGRSSR